MMMMRERLSKAHLCYESDVLQVPSPHVHDGDCRLANNVDEDDCHPARETAMWFHRHTRKSVLMEITMTSMSLFGHLEEALHGVREMMPS
jgi:hypothetical protein